MYKIFFFFFSAGSKLALYTWPFFNCTFFKRYGRLMVKKKNLKALCEKYKLSSRVENERKKVV